MREGGRGREGEREHMCDHNWLLKCLTSGLLTSENSGGLSFASRTLTLRVAIPVSLTTPWSTARITSCVWCEWGGWEREIRSGKEGEGERREREGRREEGERREERGGREKGERRDDFDIM